MDILVEFREPTGREFIDLKELLEQVLGNKVDLVTVNALKPQLRDVVLKQGAYA